MKLCRFTENGTTRIGKVVDDTVVDLSAVTGFGGSSYLTLVKLAGAKWGW